jgi:hypothetical protein
MNEQEKSAGISRRTVTKAMAWAVPAIAIAAPIPAFAASGEKPTITHDPACKAPGGSVVCDDGTRFKFGYGVPVHITNNDAVDVYITGITLTHQLPDDPVFDAQTSLALPILIPAGETVSFFFLAVHVNSQNIHPGELSFAATWGHTPDDVDHADDPLVVNVAWLSTPPGCNCLT